MSEKQLGRRPKYNRYSVALGIAFGQRLRSWLEGSCPFLERSKIKDKKQYLFILFSHFWSDFNPFLNELVTDEVQEDYITYCIQRVLEKDTSAWPSKVSELLGWAAPIIMPIDLNKVPSPANLPPDMIGAYFKDNFAVPARFNAAPPRVDLLAGKYKQSDPNSCWCCDTTERSNLYLTSVLDVASRYVLGYILTTKDPDATSLIKLVSDIIRKYKAKPAYFHTDQGTNFKSHVFTKYLRDEGIAISTDVRHDSVPGNQVIENFHGIIWKSIGLLRGSVDNLEEFERKTWHNKHWLVVSALQHYNTIRVPAGRDFTAKELYDALVEANVQFKLETTSNSVEAEIVDNIHDYAVNLTRSKQQLLHLADAGYTHTTKLASMLHEFEVAPGDSITVFRDKYPVVLSLFHAIKSVFESLHNQVQTVVDQNDELLKAQRANFDSLTAQLNAAVEEKELLNTRISDLLSKLELKEQKEAADAAARLAKKEQRQRARKAPQRNEVSREEFISVLDAVRGSNAYYVARDRVALLLIYLFGLRVGNIRLVTANMLDDLINNRSVEIKLLKDPQGKNFRLTPSAIMKEWFQYLAIDIEAVLRHHKDDPTGFIYNTSREVLTRRLNAYFKEVGDANGRYIRTHSARIAVATKSISALGLPKAQALLGHKSVLSTMRYDRNKMGPTEQKAAYDTILSPPPEPNVKPKRHRRSAAPSDDSA